MTRFAPGFPSRDVEVHSQGDIVLGAAPCADLGGMRPGGVAVFFRIQAICLSLTFDACVTTPEPGAGRLSIHGGAYAEMSQFPFTRAVARAPGGGGIGPRSGGQQISIGPSASETTEVMPGHASSRVSSLAYPRS